MPPGLRTTLHGRAVGAARPLAGLRMGTLSLLVAVLALLHRLDVLPHVHRAVVSEEHQRHLGAALDAKREEAVILNEDSDARRRQLDAR